ncbi:HGL261Wp [Eremothecium sinecaudum]|uniref:HGL261Wp n=1 Tax=Eremothecium sinecaudum TaxID=45286 RepID=A0A0X8HV44_9SACH|nr:HGL261Wp [Eremothecium sinecaudum]AMD22079.1 HGL261Wp [Eremothecium sinecaudum]
MSSVTDSKVCSPESDTKPLQSTAADLAAQWQNKESIDQIQNEMLEDEVLKRIVQATALIKEVQKERNEESPVASMDWDRLYDISSHIMDSFTKEMDEMVCQLNNLYKKHVLWQEAAFTIDSHRGAMRFGKAESWMKAKEAHLEYKRKELNQSAKVITSALQSLSKE